MTTPDLVTKAHQMIGVTLQATGRYLQLYKHGHYTGQCGQAASCVCQVSKVNIVGCDLGGWTVSSYKVQETAARH